MRGYSIHTTNKLPSIFSKQGHYLAVGTQSGLVQIWDAAAEKRTCDLRGHTGRVSSLSWNGDTLCSGSRDLSINQWDRHNPISPVRKYNGHTHEVCGLKWSPDHQLLASGGNDNKVHVHVHVAYCVWGERKWYFCGAYCTCTCTNRCTLSCPVHV